MSKLIKINDRKPIEIYIGTKTRGPISGIRLSEAVIGRILRSVDAPKDVYAMGPNNALVKLTLENYMKPEEELFNIVTTPAVDENEIKAKAEALRKSLEAKKNVEQEVKPEPVKSEPVETVITEETTEDIVEPKVQNDEKVEEVKEAETAVEDNTATVEEETKTEETAPVAEVKAPEKNYNNYNKNYNNKNKNKK